jgi:uncharacterized protein YlaN (UPF0358 family)
MNNEMNTALDNFGQKWEQLAFDSDELYVLNEVIIDNVSITCIVYRGILDTTPERVDTDDTEVRESI